MDPGCQGCVCDSHWGVATKYDLTQKEVGERSRYREEYIGQLVAEEGHSFFDGCNCGFRVSKRIRQTL